MTLTRCLSAIAGLLLCFGAGGRANTQLSVDEAGWATHVESAGLQIRCPRGWMVSCGASGQVVVRGDGGRVAVAHPFRSQSGAAQSIGREVNALSTLLPNAAISHTERLNGERDVAIATVVYSSNGKPGRGAILCYEAHGAGMLYAIGAARDDFVPARRTLISVLRSLRYNGRSSTGAPRSSAGSGAISYVSWSDPQEAAFTAEVPRGWKVTGGLYRYAPIDVRPQVDAGSPDGAVHIQCGDATLATFAPPGPSSQMRGLGEGQQYVVNGVPYMVMHFMDGAKYSREYVRTKIAKQLPGLRVGDTRDRSDMVKTLGGQQAQESWG